MRHLTALHQHCGRISVSHACTIIRAAPAQLASRHHVRDHHRCQHSTSLHSAPLHAPVWPQHRGAQRHNRSMVCASATDARSSSQQQQQQTSESNQQHQGPAGNPSWDIKMLYDGDCPLCMREVNMLKRCDAEQGRISFVDIAAPDYSSADNAGISYEQAMGEIHAINQDGTVIKNIEVFARLYEAVGLGWIYGFTKYEPLRKAADAVYAVWAKYRLPITGREDFETILRRRDERTCK